MSENVNNNNTGSKEGATIRYDFDNNKLDSLISANATEIEKLEVLGYNEDNNIFILYFGSQILKIYEQKGKSILDVFMDILPIALFFFLPIFSIIIRLLFYKNTKYSHSLVYSSYFFTFFFLIYSMYLLFSVLFNIPFWILLIIIACYLFFGIKQLFK